MSLKSQNKFDINDPRNPDCPCHKHQELADKEYEQLLASNSKNLTSQNSNPQQLKGELNSNHSTGNAVTGRDKIQKDQRDHKIKYKRKRKINKHSNLRRLMGNLHLGFWKRVPITNACFKWR